MVPSINFFPQKRFLHSEELHQSRGVAPSDFRPLRKILDCGLPQEYGPCLSSIGGGQALTSPKRHSLGKPLPYQQADTTQASPIAINLYPKGTIRYQSLFPEVIPDYGVSSYVLLPRLPLTHRAKRDASIGIWYRYMYTKFAKRILLKY